MKAKLFSIMLIFAVSGCGAVSKTPAPLPTVMLDSPSGNATPRASDSTSAAPAGGGGVTASGVIVPAQQEQMAFTLAGRVKTVNAAVGDQVRAGQVLAELDNAALRMQVEQARRALQNLTSPAGIAAAEQQLAAALQAQKDAQNKADSLLFRRASDELIDHTKGQIDLAKQQLAMASDNYRRFSRLPDGNPKRASAVVALTDAQLRLNALNAQYNWYTGRPSEIDAAVAQSNLDAAKASVQEAQWYLSAVKGESLPEQATGSNLAQLEIARVELEAAQENLDGSRLTALFAGTVARVDVRAGEVASPGVVQMIVINTNRLHVETTDLSERDVSQVHVGQAVTVTIKALNEQVSGKVANISPLADTLGGDVVYRTTIELDKLPDGLRAGMSVDVQFESK